MEKRLPPMEAKVPIVERVSQLKTDVLNLLIETAEDARNPLAFETILKEKLSAISVVIDDIRHMEYNMQSGTLDEIELKSKIADIYAKLW